MGDPSNPQYGILISRRPEIGTGQPECHDDLTVSRDGTGVIFAEKGTELGAGVADDEDGDEAGLEMDV